MSPSRPVRSPDLVELRAFCAAVDLGSLSRAARLLQVSQPALSKRMRTLEGLVGAPLLDRSSRGISPTPAGTRLYVEARKLLVQAEAVDELVAGLSGEAPVRLAASHTIAEFVLPGPLVEFERRHERHLSVELIIANSGVVRELVRDGRAEFGFAATSPPTAGDAPAPRELPFCDDEVVVAVPNAHPWADVDEIDPAELVTMPMIVRDPSANTRRTVEAALADRGLTLAPPLAEVGSTSVAKATALSENAPVLLSALALGAGDEGLTVRRIRGIAFPRRFVLLLGAEEQLLPPPTRALVEHLLASRPTEAITSG